MKKDANKNNKNHTSIPTSFFIYIFLYSHNLYCDNYDVNDVLIFMTSNHTFIIQSK